VELIEEADVLKEELLGLITNAADPEIGIIAGLNCRFVKTNSQNIFSSVCVSTAVPVYDLSVIILVISFSMFFMSYFVYSTAMKLSSPHAKEKKYE